MAGKISIFILLLVISGNYIYAGEHGDSSKVVESVLNKFVFSDLQLLKEMIHTYYSDLEKNFTDPRKLKELEEGYKRFSDTTKLISSRSITYESKLEYIFQYLKYIQDNLKLDQRLIFSRIIKRVEQLVSLEAYKDESEELNLILFLEELSTIFKNNKTTIGEIIRRDLKQKCVLIDDKESDKNQEVYKLQLHGNIVLSSDIPINWYTICPGDETRYLEIFARDRIIINIDFDSGTEPLQLVLIAPKLHVVGNRTINLSGADGKSHRRAVAEPSRLGRRGEDGLPGLPGQPGGIFIGITAEFPNGDLRIIANGGKGESGQQGSYGATALRPEKPNVSQLLDQNNVLVFKTRTFPQYYAAHLIAGGNGGDGGRGGYGGKAGQIFLHKVNAAFKPYKPKAKQGERGPDGAGGKGGRGKFGGVVLFPKGYAIKTYPTVEITHSEDLQNYVKYGAAGKRGGNSVGLKSPSDFKGSRELALVVNDYKKFVRPYLKQSERNELIIEFYNKLMSDNTIEKAYGTLGLLDELKGLEEQYFNLSTIMDLVPMYDNLLRRIEKYSSNRLYNEHGDDYTAALGYAYIAAMTRSSRLIGRDDYFVVDVEGYLDSVSKNLEELKEDKIQYVVNQAGENYRADIQRKISEVQTTIDNQIKHEIKKINRLMQQKVQDLIDETMKLQKQSLEKKEALKNARKEQMIFSIMKTVLVAASALAPGGQMAAALAFTGIQIAETFAPEYSKDKFKAEVPKSAGKEFGNAIEFMKRTMKSQQDVLEEQEDFANNERRKLQIMSDEVQNKELTVGERRKVMESINTARNQIGELKEEMKAESGEELGSLKEVEIASKLSVLFAGKEWIHAMVEAVGKDKDKLDIFAKDIESVNKDIKNLKNYQNRIYSQLIPVFESMSRTISTDQNLKIQTMADLDVSRWKVQTSLNEVKLIVKQFTEGFKVADEMNLLIENLEYTLNTLISLYDQIQNYQQENKLATYLGQLNTAKFQNYQSDNKALQDSLLETRMRIRENLALIQYERAFSALKQYVFPEAHAYLQDLNKPTSLGSITYNGKNSLLITNITANVLNIKTKLVKYKTVIYNDYDKSKGALGFRSDYGKEIYRWKNETHHEIISDLLSGKEVMLIPDARNFSHHALKVKDIRISFVARNERDQNDLDQKCKGLRMNMIHDGNSHYTCGKKMYLMHHSSVSVAYSYGGKELSLSAEKLAGAKYDLLSPFATWRVKLREYENELRKQSLMAFKNKVDLVLESSKAIYIDKFDPSVCEDDTDLSEYYQEYTPMVE